MSANSKTKRCQRGLRAATVAIAALSATAVAACTPAVGARPSDGTAAGDLLATLRVAPEGAPAAYDRDKFEHWVTQPGGEHCDTRETVLRRDGRSVRVNGACKATGGTWTSAYTGEPINDSAKVDIDHLVPLAEAWRSGADQWTPQRREAFANDLHMPQLIAVDARSNRSKADQDPASWLPTTDRCGYVQHWITVKHTYGLTIDRHEQTALGEQLAACSTKGSR